MAPASTKSKRPKLDEESFQKLLAAAFVVQEHQDQQRTEIPAEQESFDQPDKEFPTRPPFSYVMEEIVATQHQIQTRRLQLQQAIDLITDRVRGITQADGAAIALIEGRSDSLVYRTASGTSAPLLGKRTRLAKLLCAESVRNGTTLQCLEPAADFRIDSKICAARGVQSLIAVPVYRDESVAGALELVFSKRNAFGDQDVRTCQVMAGMVTEALNRAAEMDLKKAIVDERATMLKALAQLKPQLQRLAESPGKTAEGQDTTLCPNCNKERPPGQQECPHCGTSFARSDAEATNSRPDHPLSTTTPTTETRNASTSEKTSQPKMLKAPAKPLKLSEVSQSKVDETIEEDYAIPASVLDELEERLREYDPDRHVDDIDETLSVSDSQDPAELSAAEDDNLSEPQKPELLDESHESPDSVSSTSELALVPQTEITDSQNDDAGKLRITPVAPEEAWASAFKTKAWLESITDRSTGATILRYLNRYRGEIYLAAAIVVVAFAVWWSVWGSGGTGRSATSIDSPTGTTKRRPRPPEADLSLYERFLVAIGLAEPPPAPIYEGNPDTKVWVDLQTGLYYCPNADLYGTTAKGRFTSQKDAQLDQFEPADRRACD
ncbi:MAG TPA: GAF domain-containing protein [Terriglobales bacterium]|jgi:GAF domain|nr:GAF domain-containing protein [Terriglobales bacterium]